MLLLLIWNYSVWGLAPGGSVLSFIGNIRVRFLFIFPVLEIAVRSLVPILQVNLRLLRWRVILQSLSQIQIRRRVSAAVLLIATARVIRKVL